MGPGGAAMPQKTNKIGLQVKEDDAAVSLKQNYKTAALPLS
jgi:hypothetical protein